MSLDFLNTAVCWEKSLSNGYRANFLVLITKSLWSGTPDISVMSSSTSGSVSKLRGCLSSCIS